MNSQFKDGWDLEPELREKYLEIISRETLESISNLALKELEYLKGENLEMFNILQYEIIDRFKKYLNSPEVHNNLSRLVNLYYNLNKKSIVN